MADVPDAFPSAVVLSTSIVSFVSGFALGIYAIRGYLVSPALSEARWRNQADPVESDESEVDEHDSLLDHAPNWSNSEAADRRQGLRALSAGAGAKVSAENQVGAERAVPTAETKVESANSIEECKLVLVVRTDLGMTKGKIAAQCSHATLACYRKLLRASNKAPQSVEARLLARWERLGQTKIAVQAKSEDELMELMGKARSRGLTAELISDAGRTQIAAGSHTVLGIGPAPRSLVDEVTRHLKLL